MNRKLVIGALILAIMIFPFVVIQSTLTKAGQGQDPRYMFKARIQEKLGETETLTETFLYFLVDTLDGEAPATEVVILVSSGLTRGQSNVVLQPDQEFWGHGWLMDPEKYSGEQYLFFGRPQVYLWQIKGSVFWPDQVTALRLLYQAPIARVTALYYLVVFPLMDEFTIRNYVAFVAQTILIIATGVLLIRKRGDKGILVIVLLVYVLFTMLITSPVLPNPYRFDYESLYFP